VCPWNYRFGILRLGTRLCSERGGTSRHRGEHKYVQTASHLRSRSLPDDDTTGTSTLLYVAGVGAFGNQILFNALESAIEAAILRGMQLGRPKPRDAASTGLSEYPRVG